MSVILSLIFAFAVGFTGAETAPTAPAPAQQVQQVVQQDPILAMDAQATLEDNKLTAGFTDKGIDYVVQYIESDESSDSLFGEFTLESIDFPGTFHHYTYVPLSKS